MTYATVTGYPFEGYDGSDESFEELVSSGTCEDPEQHNLHTDGRWLFERCPVCGGSEPLSKLDLLARADAERDFAAAVRRQTPDGHCTGCGTQSPELVPWSGQRLCWDCADFQLDLVASAILADAPVSVGTRGLR